MTHSTQDTFDYDLLVIGSGPGGIHAAVQAAKLQRRVAIIERSPNRLGGAWIHTGTLPSKTLRESLDAVHSIRFHAGQSWVDRIVGDLAAEKLMRRAREVASQEEELVRKHLKSNNIPVIVGHGVLDDRHSVRVISDSGEAQVFTARNILIATGSRPRRPKHVPFDGWRVVDSDDLLTLTHIPKSIIIYGAGVIGCEYACIFGALGVKTIIADERAMMMQTMDQEVTGELRKAMEALGIVFNLGCKLENLKTQGPQVTCTLNGEAHTADVVFYAAGRVSNTEHLGLEKVGVRINERSAIVVNEHFQSDVPHIYAVGDVIGPPALAATSTEQARLACLHAFGEARAQFPKVFPIGIYTIPEFSSVGETEEELKKRGVDYVVGRANFTEMARGYIRGDQHGLLKLLVCRETQKILGIHVVGDDACNLVHIGMAFMLKNGHAQDFVEMVFNYPTLAETYRIAAFNALNKIFKDGVIETPKSLATIKAA